MTYLQKARLIAREAFKNRVDKAGLPYIEHLQAVTRLVESEEDEVRAIAMLHDLLQDCPEWTYDLILGAFNERIADGVRTVTKGFSRYPHYLSLIKENKDAVLVKIADLRHNMDITRLPTLGDYEIKRLRKYHAAYLELMKVKNSWK